MPRTPQGSIPLLELDPNSAIPLHRQLVEALRQAILTGRLVEGTRLPSTRSLAQDLAVSRSTVVIAFEQLNSEGYLQSRSGSGTTVPTGLAIPDTAPADAAGHPPASESIGPAASSPPIPFRPGIPALDEFAGTTFGRILRRTFREMGPDLLTVGPPSGDARLRAAIALHLRGSRKVRCDADDLIITSGAQEGLCLAFDVIIEPGDEIWMEHPGYSGARRAAVVTGAIPVPIRLDDQGMVVGEGVARWPHAKGAYVTPSHQFPTGCSLSLARRLELLEWARLHGRYIVEDDYDSEFRLEGRPLPALQGMDPDQVIYVGTFSKSLAPAIRLGFILLPPSLRDRALRIKMDRMGTQPIWLQRATAVFLEEGHFARHIRRTRGLYVKRRDALRDAVHRHLADWARLREPTGAMHAVLELSDGLTADGFTQTARNCGVEMIPLSFFAIPPDEVESEAVLVGFAGYSAGAIRKAVVALATELSRPAHNAR